MHEKAYSFVQRTVAALPKSKSVVEIGSYNVNGSVRDLFPKTDYTGVDVRPGKGVDVVADGAAYEPAKPVDTVVCCEVLEHAENAAEIIANAFAMLQVPGVLILTAAGPERQPHGNNGGRVGDEFYANVTEEDLEQWLTDAGFAEQSIERDARAGDIYAVAFKALIVQGTYDDAEDAE